MEAGAEQDPVQKDQTGQERVQQTGAGGDRGGLGQDQAAQPLQEAQPAAGAAAPSAAAAAAGAGESSAAAGSEPPASKRMRLDVPSTDPPPNPAPYLVAFPAGGSVPVPDLSQVGAPVVGTVEAVTDAAFFVSLNLGGHEFKGALLCPPAGFMGPPLVTSVPAGPPAPPVKRPRTAFNFFSDAVRPGAKERHPHADQKGISKIVGDMWSQLAAEGREPYHEAARHDKERYERELRDFQARNPRGVRHHQQRHQQQQQQQVAQLEQAELQQPGSARAYALQQIGLPRGTAAPPHAAQPAAALVAGAGAAAGAGTAGAAGSPTAASTLSALAGLLPSLASWPTSGGDVSGTGVRPPESQGVLQPSLAPTTGQAQGSSWDVTSQPTGGPPYAQPAQQLHQQAPRPLAALPPQGAPVAAAPPAGPAAPIGTTLSALRALVQQLGAQQQQQQQLLLQGTQEQQGAQEQQQSPQPLGQAPHEPQLAPLQLPQYQAPPPSAAAPGAGGGAGTAEDAATQLLAMLAGQVQPAPASVPQAPAPPPAAPSGADPLGGSLSQVMAAYSQLLQMRRQQEQQEQQQHAQPPHQPPPL